MWVKNQTSVERVPNVIYYVHSNNMKLTDSKIRGANPRSSPFKLADGEGLQLLVQPNGGKLWQFRYRFAERERTLSIGKYPGVSLAEARAAKVKAQGLLRDFIDPISDRRQARLESIHKERNSFRAVAEGWRDRNSVLWTPRHLDRTWARLENHVFPELGNRPVADIKPLEVLAVVERIEKAGAIETSHRVLRICSSVFRFAIVTGRLERNPASDLVGALKPSKPCHYPCLPAKELPEFLRTLDEVRTSEQNRLVVRILMLTGVRTGELRHSRWRDFNARSAEWRIPAEFTKMRTEHIVPLSRQCIGLLRELYRISGDGEWLFPNQQGRRHPVMSENTINHLIRRMGYKGRLVGHGFRSMFSTVLNENGFNRDAIERQLAHVERNGVRAAYNRAEYLPERREMMQWWADYIENAAKAPIASAFFGLDSFIELEGSPVALPPALLN